MIEITVNGNISKLDEPTNINEFLVLKGFEGRSVAVAVNSIVIRRTSFNNTIINDGDIVEIVRPVGGGV
ncbi:MAG: sulfur carrier protein ThiS [Dehalococcoidia bacterium]|jgi:sulfur carrier protein|uniref:Thiamine biosynthesis protein ThiS n=1 Tax=marine metagenome TaxID=408172 RepID=A0A382PDB3_9ZZZZ|nr:thiamine biosynthesis protein ThiS [Chloroflexota bacterium]MDP7088220.1 sulfur carrier protein ThiS [Dehalococcoidia bacterium]MDP7673248.1 sulfur carrier protein ThiS [Dehalococcoidia bacterium]|tara:strand:+ start:2495 stop:2701 length:207 start_codon:yes stop_codon:yes gene_type:complete